MNGDNSHIIKDFKAFHQGSNSTSASNLVGLDVKSLISDATKRSFLTSHCSDATSSLSSASATERKNFTPTSSNLTYQPLLPRRHNTDYSYSEDKQQFSKWQPYLDHGSNYRSLTSSTAPSSTGTLLSKVAMDDDISDLMSRSSLANVTESTDSALSDLSATRPMWNFRSNHPLPHDQNVERNKENLGAYNEFDPLGQGDATYFATQSSTTSNILNEASSNFLTSSASQSHSVSSVQSSYVVNEPNFSSLDSARAAGYPVITKSMGENFQKTFNQKASEKSLDASRVSAGLIHQLQTAPQSTLASLEMNASKAPEAINDHGKQICWADLHDRYVGKAIEKSPTVQVSDRFNALLSQLEALRLESIQHSPIGQIDIANAIGLLNRAKDDILAVKSANVVKNTEKHRLSNINIISVAPSETPKNIGFPITSISELQQSATKETISDRIPQSCNPKVASNDEDFKSPSDQAVVHFQPHITSTEIKQSTHATRSYDFNHSQVRSNQNYVSNEEVKDVGGEISSKRSLFPSGNSQFLESQNDKHVAYDAFSTDIQASSSHFTPKSPPLQNASLISSNDIAAPHDTSDNRSATGFVILDEKTPPGKLAKKKEQFLRGRLKKEEEQRRHQMERELEAERRKLEVKEQQEKLQQKKQEEKEKRDKIFKDYQKRKRKEEKAAQRNHGVIGEGSPANGAKKTLGFKIHSRSMERLNILTSPETQSHGVAFTIPTSSRSNCTSTTHHLHLHEEDTDSLGSGGSSEYTGPKLFKQLRSKSNRTLITNAINHCCLSGKVNEKNREKTLTALENSEDRHLMVLFRDNNCQYRALYGYHPDEEKLKKICGKGPAIIIPSMIEALFKYNSGRRAFARVPSKTLSVSIDGITIKSSLWQHAKK